MTVLVRDVMQIGVPVCRAHEDCGTVAERLARLGDRGDVVVALDEDGRACGWTTRVTLQAAPPLADVGIVLNEHIPEVPPDIPAAAAAAWMRDHGVDYAFLMHNWPGAPRPAALVERHALEEHLTEPP